MSWWFRKRAEETSEIVLVAHVLSLLVLLMALASFYNVPLGKGFHPQPSIVVFLLLAGAGTYLGRKLLMQIPSLSQPRLDEALLLAVLFPASLALLWYSGGFFAAKVVFIIPATVAAVAFGSRVGMGVAALVGTLLFFLDHRLYGGLPELAFQTSVIVGGVTLVLTWLVGRLMEVERRSQAELLRLADYDQLTGLYNHRCCLEKLAQLVEEAGGKNLSLSLVLLDVDQFRLYNTRYGYPKGDEMLAAAGEILRQEVGPPAYAARHGGSRFALVLPGRGKVEALAIAEDFREKLEKRMARCLAQCGPEASFNTPRVSVGVATYPADGEGVVALVQAAEDDLFRIKYSKGKIYLYRSVLSHINTLRVQEAFHSLQTLIALINARDRYTFGHSERVLAYSLSLADKLNLSEEERTALRYGAYLHDIGKIELSYELLNKDGYLSEKEWEVMKLHPVWGSQILSPLSAFRKAVAVVRSHHENYDGTGYPDGLKGDEIPLLARIVRIADSFDAMTTDRPYRRALTVSEAIGELTKHAGTFYDPRLVPLFVEAVRDRERRSLVV
jgi:diguanylate cyclase (GGDEF)-like protein